MFFVGIAVKWAWKVDRTSRRKGLFWSPQEIAKICLPLLWPEYRKMSSRSESFGELGVR
jgi:hypothetical protein